MKMPITKKIEKIIVNKLKRKKVAVLVESLVSDNDSHYDSVKFMYQFLSAFFF